MGNHCTHKVGAGNVIPLGTISVNKKCCHKPSISDAQVFLSHGKKGFCQQYTVEKVPHGVVVLPLTDSYLKSDGMNAPVLVQELVKKKGQGCEKLFAEMCRTIKSDNAERGCFSRACRKICCGGNTYGRVYVDETGARYQSKLDVSKERNKYDESVVLGSLNYLSDRFGFHGKFKNEFGISMYLCGNPQILEVEDSSSVETGKYRGANGCSAAEVRAVYVTMWIELVDDSVAFNYTPKYHARVFDQQTCQFVWTRDLVLKRYKNSQQLLKKQEQSQMLKRKLSGVNRSQSINGVGVVGSRRGSFNDAGNEVVRVEAGRESPSTRKSDKMTRKLHSKIGSNPKIFGGLRSEITIRDGNDRYDAITRS